MPEKTVPVKKRRFLSKDYDFLAEYIDVETGRRKTLQARKEHEALWAEVDRQVKMKPMTSIRKDPELDWKNALEMGDMSTASEVLSADTLRLIFPQDRMWLQTHVNIDFERLKNRTKNEIPEEEVAKVQKKADSELRALMTQQHHDFGFRARVELSIKESLHHGSFVAEVQWETMQQYAMKGVFSSAASPVWTPHSMWNCYPETLELGVNLIYQGSMIICSEKSFEWVMRQTDYINLAKFRDRTTDTKGPIELKTFIGDITVRREGEDMFLPNMKLIVANKTVLFAKAQTNSTIIFSGYDRIDVRSPYYMSPLVKQSTNHRIVTIIANKFLDNVDLKLEPPTVYDGNDPTLVAQGGPKMIPGVNTPTKGGVQNFKQIDVGDPTWAAQAIEKFQSDIHVGTGVSPPRAGGERQADRVTATQIEEESSGGKIRTIDFTGKIEKGIESYCYMQHEMNKEKMTVYKFYNADMGMPDFDSLKKEELPDEVHFEAIGSKGVISERRRAQQTAEVTSMLLGNERTAELVNVEEVARQLYMDAGNKNPERLLNLSEGNTALKRQVEALRAKMQEMIDELRAKLQEITQKLVEKEMALKLADGRLTLRNERAEGTENSLREEVRALKSQIDRSTKLLQELGSIQDEAIKNEKIKNEIEHNQELQDAEEKGKDFSDPSESVSVAPAPSPVIVNIEKAAGHQVKRDPATGNMTGVIAVNDVNEISGEVSK